MFIFFLNPLNTSFFKVKSSFSHFSCARFLKLHYYDTPKNYSIFIRIEHKHIRYYFIFCSSKTKGKLHVPKRSLIESTIILWVKKKESYFKMTK